MAGKQFSICNYIDHLIGCHSPDVITRSYHTLLNVLTQLGLPISTEKLCKPSYMVPCLGIDINISDGTLSLPQDKLESVVATCQRWANAKTATRHQLQALVGLLMYVHKCVKPARLIVNRVLDTLRAPPQGNSTLSPTFQLDISWFNNNFGTIMG